MTLSSTGRFTSTFTFMVAVSAGLTLARDLNALSGAQPGETAQPNILLLLADDAGWGDFGCYGATELRTPHIDSLARAGVRFTDFHACPECTPTRTALLTGRYEQRVGGLECAIGTGNVGRYDDTIRLAASHDLGLPVAETSIARLLKEAGYATAIVGKWHLGYEDKFSPNLHGFDHALYCLGGGMDYFAHVEDPPAFTPVLRLDGGTIERRGYFTEMIAADAVEWLQQQTSRDPRQPFFLYVPFTAPHSPYQAPDEEHEAPLPAGSPRWRQGRAPATVYNAMIENLDQAVGRILRALDERRLATNTLVIFASDNGGTACARQNGLRRAKGTTFEGGIRVPCIVRWPGVVPAGSECRAPARIFDLTVSMARAAGVAPTNGRPFDGLDILGFVQDGQVPPARPLFWRGRRGTSTWKAVREGAFKYIWHTNGGKPEEYLFDLEHDLGEQNDLLAEEPAVTERLKRLLAAWEQEVQPVR